MKKNKQFFIDRRGENKRLKNRINAKMTTKFESNDPGLLRIQAALRAQLSVEVVEAYLSAEIERMVRGCMSRAGEVDASTGCDRMCTESREGVYCSIRGRTDQREGGCLRQTRRGTRRQEPRPCVSARGARAGRFGEGGFSLKGGLFQKGFISF